MNTKSVAVGIFGLVIGLVFLVNLNNILNNILPHSYHPFSGMVLLGVMVLEFITVLMIIGGGVLLLSGSELKFSGIWIAVAILVILFLMFFFSLGVFRGASV